MMYKVIMLECRLPTHCWQYEFAFDALKQLERLTLAFEEVNEVSFTIVKHGHDDRNFSCSELIKNQVL